MSSIIITGATGTAGSAILNAALASPQVTKVTVLARRAPAITNQKLTTIIVPSAEYPDGFEQFPQSLVDNLKGPTACIWALGVSQRDVSKEEYIKITYDYTLGAANALAQLGTKASPFRFVFISGEGADQSEKGYPLFSKIKGRTERSLVEIESESFQVVNLRPGGIIPSPERRAATSWTQRAIIGAASMLVPSRMIESTDLAVASVELASGARGWERRDSTQRWIDNATLNKMAEEYKHALSP